MTTGLPSPRQPTDRALEARRARTKASLERLQAVVERMVKAKTPVTIAAVARQAEVSRTFLYEHAEARRIVADAAALASGRRAQDRATAADALDASWRERALNCEDAVKDAHAEILRQREHVAELLGQVRDLQTGWSEEDRVRMTGENLALKRRVRNLETEQLSLAERLGAARDNNRFADKRRAELEAHILELESGPRART